MIVHLRFHFFAFGILELESPQGPPMGLPLPADTKVAHMSLLSLGILAPPLETHRPPPRIAPGTPPRGTYNNFTWVATVILRNQKTQLKSKIVLKTAGVWTHLLPEIYFGPVVCGTVGLQGTQVSKAHTICVSALPSASRKSAWGLKMQTRHPSNSQIWIFAKLKISGISNCLKNGISQKCNKFQ